MKSVTRRQVRHQPGALEQRLDHTAPENGGSTFDGYACLGKDGLSVHCPSCGMRFGEVELPGDRRGIVYLFSDAWEWTGDEWTCKPDTLFLLLKHPEWMSRVSPSRRNHYDGAASRRPRKLGPTQDDPVVRARCGRCGKHIGIALQTLVEHASQIQGIMHIYESNRAALARHESWLRWLRKDCPPLKGFRVDPAEWNRQQDELRIAEELWADPDLTDL